MGLTGYGIGCIPSEVSSHNHEWKISPQVSPNRYLPQILKRSNMSPEGRARIASAQKKRWAKVKRK
jgi:hypothetical protein